MEIADEFAHENIGNKKKAPDSAGAFLKSILRSSSQLLQPEPAQLFLEASF